jgi:hypothetical protein
MKRSVAEIAEPLAFETAQKAKKLELTAYFGGQPTLVRCRRLAGLGGRWRLRVASFRCEE